MLVNLHGIFLAQQNVTREGMLYEFFRQLHSLHLICNCNLIKLQDISLNSKFRDIIPMGSEICCNSYLRRFTLQTYTPFELTWFLRKFLNRFAISVRGPSIDTHSFTVWPFVSSRCSIDSIIYKIKITPLEIQQYLNTYNNS